jgi:TRADD-N domain-containing protein
MRMDSAGAALIITVLAGTAVILAAVIIAARREQRRNEDQIAQVRGVIGRVSPIDMSVNGDQHVPTRRGGSTVDGWTTDDAPDQSLMRGVAERTAARFEIQQTHYANALRQSTTYFYFSLGVGLVGFALLAVGVGIAMADRLEVGTVTAIGGVLAEAAAALVFNQANRAKSDAQANLAAIARAAERDENNLMAYIYASRIQDLAMRDATHAALAREMAGAAEQ